VKTRRAHALSPPAVRTSLPHAILRVLVLAEASRIVGVKHSSDDFLSRAAVSGIGIASTFSGGASIQRLERWE
jgi:hypothetical protein